MTISLGVNNIKDNIRNAMKRFNNLIIGVIICIFSFIALSGNAIAGTGVKITSPSKDTIVNPGQTIEVTIEAVDGFAIKNGMIIVQGNDIPDFTSLPVFFTITVPKELTETLTISVFAMDLAGNNGYDMINLHVQQTATIQSFVIWGDKVLDVYLDWNNNIKTGKTGNIAITQAIYSDNVERKIPIEELTFTSSDPSIVSVDGKGNYEIYKVGDASITVSAGNDSQMFPLVFHKPIGIRPTQTTPPTVNMDITPKPNAAGWNNSDITITLTSQASNESAGIDNIDYEFPYLSAESTFIKNSQAIIAFSTEGINLFRYGAMDKEGNDADEQSTTINLDKTPPVTTATVTPQPNADGWITSLPVSVSFTATDNLSGVASITPGVTLTQNGEYNLEYFSTDVAGNIESPKTLSVKVAANDFVPPQITLGLQRLGLWSWFNFYRLTYSATDDNSGVKEAKAGLVTPDISTLAFKFKVTKTERVTIDEKKRIVTIEAPQPETIMLQLKQNLLLINNNELLHLNKTRSQGNWEIDKNGPFLFIKAPSIVFKALATDKAGNSASQELEFPGKN